MVFVVALFFSTNKTEFKNQYQENGLVYNGNEELGDLINRDTDGDGVSDWQEGLFGTDPMKKSTFDGIADDVYIAKMGGQMPQNGELNLNIQDSGTLTETDKLSREIFSTIATLNQTGIVDQATIDKLSESLASKLDEPSSIEKFQLNDLIVLKTDTVEDVRKYDSTLNNIFTKYQKGPSVLDVLDKFIIDEDNIDESALADFDAISQQLNSLVEEARKTAVPPSLAALHLEVLNSLQGIIENINNIKLYDTDVLVAIVAISKYSSNSALVESAVGRLDYAIQQRLAQ